MIGLRDIYFKLVEHPGLRPYFYDGREVPSVGLDREQVLLIAEAFCDVLEGGLMASSRVPGYDYYGNWRFYCNDLTSRSPALRFLLERHPMYWPKLHALCIA